MLYGLDLYILTDMAVYLSCSCAEKIHQASAAALRAKKQLLHKAKGKAVAVRAFPFTCSGHHSIESGDCHYFSPVLVVVLSTTTGEV